MTSRISSLLMALVLVPLLVRALSPASLGFGASCRVPPGSQANLNIRQPDGNYLYVFIINANYKGKWAVSVEQEGDGLEQSRLYTNPLVDFQNGLEVSHNVTVNLGWLSKWNRNLYVHFRGGYCNVYSLEALYGR